MWSSVIFSCTNFNHTFSVADFLNTFYSNYEAQGNSKISLIIKNFLRTLSSTLNGPLVRVWGYDTGHNTFFSSKFSVEYVERIMNTYHIQRTSWKITAFVYFHLHFLLTEKPVSTRSKSSTELILVYFTMEEFFYVLFVFLQH